MKEHKREFGAIPRRARRCNRGRTLQICHCLHGRREGAISRLIRKSEDLPEMLSVILGQDSDKYNFWEKIGLSWVNYMIGLGFLFSRP